jgi:amidase
VTPTPRDASAGVAHEAGRSASPDPQVACHLGADRQITEFDRSAPCTATIEPGARIEVETGPGSRAVTGPIEVAGAAPGGVLAIHVEQILTVGDGQVWARPGAGVLGERLFDLLPDRRVIDVPVDGNHFHFMGRPLRTAPMVGVIGVTPPGPALPTYWPGRHGGNLDCGLIAAGCTVYLPIFNRGAGLGVGDVHARMGDGEVMTSGLEICGSVRFSVSVPDAAPITGPIVVTDTCIAFLSSAKSLDEAVQGAVYRGAMALANALEIDIIDAGMLTSLIGDLRLAQVVNPRNTAMLVFDRRDVDLDVSALGV